MRCARVKIEVELQQCAVDCMKLFEMKRVQTIMLPKLRGKAARLIQAGGYARVDDGIMSAQWHFVSTRQGPYQLTLVQINRGPDNSSYLELFSITKDFWREIQSMRLVQPLPQDALRLGVWCRRNPHSEIPYPIHFPHVPMRGKEDEQRSLRLGKGDKLRYLEWDDWELSWLYGSIMGFREP